MLSGLRKIFSVADPEPTPGRDILLTGLPRSGTTLACRLLGECPGVIALNEPLAADLFQDRDSALTAVGNSFRSIRASLQYRGEAPARTRDGLITDNAFSESGTARERVVRRTTVRFDPKPAPGFTLIFKHNAEFTLLFPELLDRYPCHAVIRNPLAVLASWASVDIAASRGRVSKADRLLPELHRTLEDLPTLLDKQLHILGWYLERFRLLPPGHLLRYEDIVAQHGAPLSHILDLPPLPGWHLQERNRSGLYRSETVRAAAKALLAREGPWWEHYRRDDVKDLMDQLLTS